MDFEITPQIKAVLDRTMGLLGGKDRRLFMASIVQGMGRGGALWAHRELGWDRTTVRKGLGELQRGISDQDAPGRRGRKGYEAKLPTLAKDLRDIGEGASQTDPTFRTTQLYRKLTAADARRQLIEKGYAQADIPSERSLRRMLSALGFKPRRVAKSKPLRKVRQTDAIFAMLRQINTQADADAGTVRVSIDTKTTVPIGNLSRGGRSRRREQALDHDLEPEAKLTPFGIHRPDTAETWLSFSTGSVTADFMADRLCELWPTLKKTVILHIPW